MLLTYLAPLKSICVETSMNKIISTALLSAVLLNVSAVQALTINGSTTTGGVTHFPATTITLTAADDAATLIVESTAQKATINVNVLDNDINGDVAALINSSVGQYGYIVGGISAEGALTYQVDLNNPAVQNLLSTPGAQPLKDTFIYKVNAASPNEHLSGQATITINIVAGYVVTPKAYDLVESIVVEDAIAATSTTSGTSTTTVIPASTVTGNLKDYNNGLSNTTDTSLRYQILDNLYGKYGYLTFSTSTNAFVYTLNTSFSEVQALRNSGNALTDIFNYSVTNKNNVSATAKIMINIVSSGKETSTDNVEIENNNKFNFATPLNNEQYMRGNLMNSSDRDWYYINSSGNEIINFELCPQGFACNNQKAWVMYIFDGDKLTQAMESATIPLYLRRDDTGAILDTTNYNHMYLLYNSGVFDDALLGVIDPCYGTKTAVDIGTGTFPPGSTRNYFVAISSPLQRSGSGDSKESTCSVGNIMLTEAGPSFDEQTSPSTTTSTVGNTSSTTTSTTKKVTTTREYIAIFPNSDDQYTFKVSRTGISPIATKTSKDEAVYSAASGSALVPKVRVNDQLFSVQLQQAITPKSAKSTFSFGITGAQLLNDQLSPNAYVGTYNPANNIVKLPKVTDQATNQSFSVDLRYKPDNTLELLSVTPIK